MSYSGTPQKLGTPAQIVLTNATGLPITTGVSGLGTDVGTFLATPSSANLAAAVTGETGSGALVFGTSPALTTPNIGAATAASLLLPASGGTPVAIDFYEQYKTTTASSTGGIVSTGNVTYSLVRFGKLVIFQFQSVITDASSAGGTASITAIPARFRPLTYVNAGCFGRINFVPTALDCYFNSDGSMYIGTYSDASSQGGFSAGQNARVDTFSACWTIL